MNVPELAVGVIFFVAAIACAFVVMGLLKPEAGGRGRLYVLGVLMFGEIAGSLVIGGLR